MIALRLRHKTKKTAERNFFWPCADAFSEMLDMERSIIKGRRALGSQRPTSPYFFLILVIILYIIYI